MKTIFLSSLLFLMGGFSSFAQTVNSYVFTGASEYWTVPAGVTSIFVTATGAAGGCDTLGGAGAVVCDSIPVTPGMMLEINVGGISVDTNGGWNGGGAGTFAIDSAHMSCGGGGASDIRVPPYALGDRILVAAGGGGKGGGNPPHAEGGSAGCPDGLGGGNGWVTGGGGGTTTMGGTGGAPWGAGNTGENGSLGIGGNGAPDTCYNEAPGGGGGGGWYGGGGGAADCFTGTGAGGGGGAGSSYYSGNGCCSSALTLDNGTVVIEYIVGVSIDEDALQFSVYPIPANDIIQVQFNNSLSKNTVLRIVDLSGRIVQSELLLGGSLFEINVSELPAGAYLIQVENFTQQLIIQ